MRRYVLSFILLLLPLFSSAEGLSYPDLQRISVSPERLEGQFSQEKYLNSMGVSLASSGVFDYQRGKLIRWETVSPVQNELLVTPSQIVSRQGGQNLLQLGSDDNPAVKAFSGIFFAVLTADWGKLAQFFSITGQLVGEDWQAELLPVDDTIRQVVTSVELKGDKLLREVVLFENTGDRITIRFNQLKL